MSISLYANVPKPVVPISEVASTPVNPTTSAGTIAPTLDVAALGAVKGTPIPTTIDPTLEVAVRPVGVTISVLLACAVPRAEVACKPVSPTTSAGVIAPTLEVAASPVNATPIPATTCPTLEVTDRPDIG